MFDKYGLLMTSWSIFDFLIDFIDELIDKYG